MISPAERALLEADTAGVPEEMERIRREINVGFYPTVIRRWIASLVGSVPIPPVVRLAERIGGRSYRTSATTRRKYTRIASKNIARDEDPELSGRILALVENDVFFVKWSGLKDWQRKYVAGVISGLCPGGSLVEVGAGDLSSLVGIARVIDPQPRRLGAVDISEQRLIVGRRWARDQHVDVGVMAAANGMALPFADSTWDVVLTYSCLEQNSVPLDLILRELHRVTGRYLVLVEPSYELGHPLFRRRIRKAGYVRGIPTVARKLGFDIIRHDSMPVRRYISDLALTVIAKR